MFPGKNSYRTLFECFEIKNRHKWSVRTARIPGARNVVNRMRVFAESFPIYRFMARLMYGDQTTAYVSLNRVHK